jgi:hypothetical protein
LKRLLFIGLIACRLFFGDGGAVLVQKQAGPFLVTVFGEPVPLRVGRADLSVMCQRSDNKENVSDAQVLLHFRRPPGEPEILEMTVPARQGKATNKLLYAGSLTFPSTGKWRLSADIRKGNDEALIAGEVEVLPKQPAIVAYWPFIVFVPLAAFLFALNRRLRRKRMKA